MNEYFARTVSFPAPIVGDESTRYISAESPQAALDAIRKDWRHPCDLHTASIYASADAYHKRLTPLAVYSFSQ